MRSGEWIQIAWPGISGDVASAAPSNPTDSTFFRAGVPGCVDCATFHGDYNNLSYGSDGVANLTWTDMSIFMPAANGFAQFIFYARK